MGLRKNLVHEKLKKTNNKNDLIQFNVKIPAYLLEGVQKYGDTAKIIKRGLELLNTDAKRNLRIVSEVKDNIISIQKSISLLELEEDLNQEQLELLEVYRDCYFKLKGAKIMKRGYLKK